MREGSSGWPTYRPWLSSSLSYFNDTGVFPPRSETEEVAERLHARLEVIIYDARNIIGKCHATVARFCLQDERREVFADFVNDFGMEDLNKGALGPEEAVEEKATCAHLLMHGQGFDSDP